MRLSTIREDKRRVFFVDLDETLICSELASDTQRRLEHGYHLPEAIPLIKSSPTIEVRGENYVIVPRPHVSEFIESLNNMGDVYILTSSDPEYANKIVDVLNISAQVLSTRDFEASSPEQMEDPNRGPGSIKRLIGDVEFVLIDDLPLDCSGMNRKMNLLGVEDSQDHGKYSVQVKRWVLGGRFFDPNDTELLDILRQL